MPEMIEILFKLAHFQLPEAVPDRLQFLLYRQNNTSSSLALFSQTGVKMVLTSTYAWLSLHKL